MANKSKNIDWYNFSFSIVLLIAALGMFIVFFKQQNDQQKQISIEIHKEVSDAIQESQNKSSDFPDYNSLKNLTPLNLVPNFDSWTPNSQIPEQSIKRSVILTKGSLSKGYIYIRASLDGTALTKWESIYMKMNYEGGHLFSPQSLPVPRSQKTELLFALNDVPHSGDFFYSEQTVPYRANWFAYLTEGNRIDFFTFISSWRPAKLEEVTLYYECTKDSKCELTLEK